MTPGQRRREEFHRDYEGRRGEFINGRIHVPPPARWCEMQVIGRFSNLLASFVQPRELGEVVGGKCLVHCQRNDYEPDVCFFGSAKAAAFTADTLLFTPPDLVVEVFSPVSTEHYRKLKHRDYARNGVSEYWVADVDERTVEQYILPPGEETYELKARLAKTARLNSRVLKEFSVPVSTFFDAGKYWRTLRELIGAD